MGRGPQERKGMFPFRRRPLDFANSYVSIKKVPPIDEARVQVRHKTDIGGVRRHERKSKYGV